MVPNTMVVLVENQPGVLARVAGLFARRGFNIESLTVGATPDPALARLTIQVAGDDHTVEQVAKQLNKLINVLKVRELDPAGTLVRELALVKIKPAAERRAEALHVAEIFRANVVDVGRQTLVVEITGDQEKVAAFLELMRDFGIVDVARTGAVAMERGARASVRAAV